VTRAAWFLFCVAAFHWLVAIAYAMLDRYAQAGFSIGLACFLLLLVVLMHLVEDER
jgi:hypothetical protein